MLMSKAEKEKMEALAIATENVCKANKILTAAIKKTIKENPQLSDGDQCTLIHLKKALEKIKGKKANGK